MDLQSFGDPKVEAQSLIDRYSPAMLIEWIGRYEFLIERMQEAQELGIPVAKLLEHARQVLELLRAGCKAGQRIV